MLTLSNLEGKSGGFEFEWNQHIFLTDISEAKKPYFSG